MKGCAKYFLHVISVLILVCSCNTVQPLADAMWTHRYDGYYAAHDMKTGKYRIIGKDIKILISWYMLELNKYGDCRIIIYDDKGKGFYGDGEWQDCGKYIILYLPDTMRDHKWDGLTNSTCLERMCIVFEKKGKNKLKLKYSDTELKK